MSLIAPVSKLERAIRSLLVLQGKATDANCFISNDNRKHTFPNRIILSSGFTPTRPHRPEGWVNISIVHRFSVSQAVGSKDTNVLRKQIDEMLSDTMESLSFGDGQNLNKVADAITTAGRWLAQTDGTEAGDEIAANNADMANFRCDDVRMGSPFLTRGKAEDDDAGHWCEVLNFLMRVSDSAN